MIPKRNKQKNQESNRFKNLENHDTPNEYKYFRESLIRRHIIYKGVMWIQDWRVCLVELQQLLHSRRTERKFDFIKWKTLLTHLSTITKACTLACSMEFGIYLSIYLFAQQ